ncbi:MAG TPA: protein kinase, partial [Planctomycetaceae bacterium]
LPDSIESDIASGTAVPGGAIQGTAVPPPPTVPPASSLPESDIQTASALPRPAPRVESSLLEPAAIAATAVPADMAADTAGPDPAVGAATAVPDPHGAVANATLDLAVAAPTAAPNRHGAVANATLDLAVAAPTAAPDSKVAAGTAGPDRAVAAATAAPQPDVGEASSPSRPNVPVSAAPLPPADDESSFDAGHSIKPRESAVFDKTEIEDSPSDYIEATQIEESLNASGTIPIEKPTEPIERAGGGKKGDRQKDGAGPETYLIIQPRDVSRPDEFNRARPAAPIRYDYDVSELIGEGGMGVVYQASQASLDRDVALKMIKPRGLDEMNRARYTVQEAERVEKAMQKRDREWFLSEAVVTANLEHPYIVPIYDVIKDRKDSLFYAMKWVRGTPWSKLIQDKAKSESEHLEILQKVSDAVAFAHEKGVIHRDLKPENVMVGNHGEVYVMDWGAALVTPQFERSTNLSQSSSGFGSVLYAAPELFTGGVEQITARSDVYLLGAILFEIISGYAPHPYPRSKSEALQNLRGNRIRETDYKGELLDIALKAMATEPADRYASVQEFQTAIREYQSHTVSLELSTRAQGTLETAEASGDYHDYARAVFAFAEARDMWPGNVQARDGVGQAKLQYAQAALTKG